MKRIIVSLLVILQIMMLGGCKNSDVKSEKDILRDLKESLFVANFITETFGIAVYFDEEELKNIDNTTYRLTDVTILSRETKKKSIDTVQVKVTAEADFAHYSGEYSLKYKYDRKEGWILDSVYQDYDSHKFEYFNLTPPDETVILDFIHNEFFPKYESATEVTNYKVQSIDERDDYYQLILYYTRNDGMWGIHDCVATYECVFERYRWEFYEVTY